MLSTQSSSVNFLSLGVVYPRCVCLACVGSQAVSKFYTHFCLH